MLFFLCFLFTSFMHKEPEYCKMVDKLVSNYVNQIAKPHQLTFAAYGGAMMDDIQEITMRFISNKEMNVDQARELYVMMMESFLQRVNSSQELRPFMHNYPFEITNINLTIDFENSSGRITNDGHVAMIFIGRNQELLFRGYNSDNEDFYSLCREPYAKALKQVTGNNSSSSSEKKD